MTRREAALILGLRESAAEERIKEAHRRIMIANHPDSGGTHSTAQPSAWHSTGLGLLAVCIQQQGAAAVVGSSKPGYIGLCGPAMHWIWR